MKKSTISFALVAAALIFALTMGIRQSVALFIGPINSATGLGFATISLAFAVAQLVWGITQPVAGAVADRYGTGRALAIGALLVAISTALTPAVNSQWALIVTVGLMAAIGAGFAGPSVLIAATSRFMPAERCSFAMGFVNAGGSLGQFMIAPLASALLVTAGWASALWVLAALMTIAIPLSIPLRGKPDVRGAAGAGGSLGQAIRTAMKDPNFLLLNIGFMVCGFHVAFIATHMPGVVALCGLPPTVGGWSLSVIGLFNIAGSLAVGWLAGRYQMKSLLSAIYALRALAVLAFLMAPKSGFTVLVFSAVLGLTYLSTVPPTAGLVMKFYGPQYMATLFGLVMLSHQIGGFLGAYLGGKTLDLTRSYDWMWYADIVLAIGAAIVHLPIRERATHRGAAVAA
ncbi:MAG: MFS transporter [Noviherbaspirillum sp.]